jgi:hypothetical protein
MDLGPMATLGREHGMSTSIGQFPRPKGLAADGQSPDRNGARAALRLKTGHHGA